MFKSSMGVLVVYGDRHMNHINALPIESCAPLSWERLHGSRRHRPIASSCTLVVSKASPQAATMTPPPTAAHAKHARASYVGSSGSHRSTSPSSVNASHDLVGWIVWTSWMSTMPPRTAKRPSLNTHPLLKRCMTLGRVSHARQSAGASLSPVVMILTQPRCTRRRWGGGAGFRATIPTTPTRYT